jgi:hypothetical protein
MICANVSLCSGVCGCRQAYRREEVLKRLGIDEREVHAAEHPREWVPTGSLEAVPGAADLLLPASVRQNHAVLCHFALFRGEPPAIQLACWYGTEI